MIKVVIIDQAENTKIDQYQHPAILAKRAEIQHELNQSLLKPIDRTIYEKSEGDIELLKLAKKQYKKNNNKQLKEELMKEILSHKTPEWGSVRLSLSKN